MLKGKRLLVTSGPTRAPLDRVRYLTNKSSGQLGTAIAKRALALEADVTFVYGKGSIAPSPRDLPSEQANRLVLIEIETVEDLAEVVQREIGSGDYDAMIHSMAVLDFAPAELLPGKTGSDREEWVVRLVPTPKVIARVKDLDPHIFLVGFKLEVDKSRDELVAIAEGSLRRNRADLVVANDLTDIEGGRHLAYLVAPGGEVLARAEGKAVIAQEVIRAVENALSRQDNGQRGRSVSTQD